MRHISAVQDNHHQHHISVMYSLLFSVLLYDLFYISLKHEAWYLKNKRPTWCHLLFYFTSYVLNMFRTLIYPSSGACDYSVELPHWNLQLFCWIITLIYCSWFDVCWRFGVVGLKWYPGCRLKNNCCCASACNPDTIQNQTHRISNTHRTKNNRSMW